jgi:hypothetical protein
MSVGTGEGERRFRLHQRRLTISVPPDVGPVAYTQMSPAGVTTRLTCSLQEGGNHFSQKRSLPAEITPDVMVGSREDNADKPRRFSACGAYWTNYPLRETFVADTDRFR